MEITKLKIKNKYNEFLACEINKSDNIKAKDKPSLLILHALTGKKENKTINFLAKNIAKQGYNTIQFDFSGHGESEGKLKESTVTKQLEDINSVLNQINTEKIILIGNSFSVITSLAFAKKNRKVVGLILISGRANYLEYIESLEKKRDKYRLTSDVFVDESFIIDYKKYNPLENIKSFKNPVLIVHGENDRVIPKKDAELLYDYSDSLRKYLFILPQAGHRFLTDKQKIRVLDKIIEFLKSNFEE